MDGDTQEVLTSMLSQTSDIQRWITQVALDAARGRETPSRDRVSDIRAAAERIAALADRL